MNTDNINLPSSPDYRRRLFPSLIDECANSEPSKPFAAVPKSSDLPDGFVDISSHELARGINRCSWCLEDELGKARSFETVGCSGFAVHHTHVRVCQNWLQSLYPVNATTARQNLLTSVPGFLHLTPEEPAGSSVSFRTDRMQHLPTLAIGAISCRRDCEEETDEDYLLPSAGVLPAR